MEEAEAQEGKIYHPPAYYREQRVMLHATAAVLSAQAIPFFLLDGWRGEWA